MCILQLYVHFIYIHVESLTKKCKLALDPDEYYSMYTA